MANTVDIRAHETQPTSPMTQTLDSEDSQSLSSLKCLIDDDVYNQLQRHFLRQGRGRPCDMPPVPAITNGLLLQLFFLTEENNSSYRQLKEWLEKLVPHTDTVTESRIYQRVQFIIKSCTSRAVIDTVTFLKEIHCFHELPDPLSSLGLKRFHISGAVPYTQPPANHVNNDIVIELEKIRAHERESQSFIHGWIRKLSIACIDMSNSQLKRKVDKCFSEYKKLSKNKNKSEDSLNKFNNFLRLPFASKETIISVPTQSDKCDLCSTLVKENKIKDSLIHKLEQSNDNSISKLNVQIEINTTLNEDKKKIEEAHEIIKMNHDKIQKQRKQELSSNDICRKELEEVKKSNLYNKNYSQKRKLEELTVERDTLLKEKEEDSEKLKSVTKDVITLKKKMKIEQTMKSKLKIANEKITKINHDLTDIVEDESKFLRLREDLTNHRYSNDIRQTYYALQGEGNVSATNCSTVVATVAKHLFHTELKEGDLPCKTTSINFANEANIIAQHQVVDEIQNSKHFTFASDATSRQKAHYLEQHLQLSNGKILSLGYSEIASDDSDTLLEKCVAVFRKVCEIYCLDNNSDPDVIFKEVIRKLKCLMSDRASVMKCFDKKMAAFKCDLLEDEDCSTHFIFCNAHFLLALSSAAEEALRSVESEWKENGAKLGRDNNPIYQSFEKNKESAAVRVIRMAAECMGPRGDEKNGSRQEWLAFCRSNDIRSLFCSYRSNRFNNLFQNATALLQLKTNVELFLNDYASHSNLKLRSIIADIQDKRIISNIVALSFFHIFFTEPYWQLMNSKKTYLDFPVYVKSMDATLTLWQTEDFDLSSSTSVFPDFQANETDTRFIREFFTSEAYDNNIFRSSLGVILERSGDALKRQLSDFLIGGIFGGEVAEDVKVVLSSCPLTNLTGERLFGDLDYDMNKRRNASLHLRSTTGMWKHNKTVQWLDNQNQNTVQQMIEKGIKYGPEFRQRHRDEKEAVREKVKKRINDNKWRKEEKDIKTKQRKLAAIDAMLGTTLATTKEELDTLFNGPKATEKLKDQIRFRSVVREEDITLSGNKQTLYDKLLRQIQISTSGESSNTQ